MKCIINFGITLAAFVSILLVSGSCSDDDPIYSASNDLIGDWYVDRIMWITDTTAITYPVTKDNEYREYYCELSFKADSIVNIGKYVYDWTTDSVVWDSTIQAKFRENGNLVNVYYYEFPFGFIFDEKQCVLHNAIDLTDEDGTTYHVYYYFTKLSEYL